MIRTNWASEKLQNFSTGFSIATPRKEKTMANFLWDFVTRKYITVVEYLTGEYKVCPCCGSSTDICINDDYGDDYCLKCRAWVKAVTKNEKDQRYDPFE